MVHSCRQESGGVIAKASGGVIAMMEKQNEIIQIVDYVPLGAYAELVLHLHIT